ncbi:MAG: HAMP domain-containing histidine kinase [Ruminococcus sp.]|nr:HAMP domain-containing histidine kinase [Ruminococcus sp.]
MKRTHTIQKPSYKKILLKRLVIGFIINAVICAAVLVTASVLYKKYIYEDGQDRIVKRYEYIRSELEHYDSGILTDLSDVDSVFADIGFYLTGETERDQGDDKPYIACRLLDKDNDVIADHRQLMRLECIGTKTACCLCHPDVYDEVYEAVEKYNKKIDSLSDDDRQYGLFVNEAYLDGKYFYPRLSIRSISNDDFYKNGLGDWQEEEAVEFYPKDTSSMEYVEYKDKETQLYFTAWEDHTDAAVESALDEYVKDKRYDDEYKNVFVFSYPYFSQKGSVVPQYTLVCAFPYSFVKRFSMLVWICAAAAFMISVLIAFISSKLCYADRKAQYEIFTARRETTNAMAHDLKVPLTAMSGYCEMLREDIDPQKRQHYLDMISSSAEQMNRIVTDILELAKTESDVKALDIQSVDVREVCTQIVQELNTAFEKKSMKCAVTDGEIQIKADRQLFTQAVTNLMHNALVYSKQGSEVDITIDSRQLRIENVPKSMPNTEPDELMKAFVKGNSFRGENSGSGVGLAVANHDLQRMGFTLTIEMTDDRFAAVCRFK